MRDAERETTLLPNPCPMELARRAAHRADAGDIYGIPTPSADEQMTIQELHRELLHEKIRQRIIVDELAKQQELEAEFQRELLNSDVDARFRQITMPHHGTSPLPHDEPLDVPVSIARRPVKDRTVEWDRPPRCRPASEEDAPIVGAKQHKNALSGMKRKRTAETPSLICSICDAKCYRETDLQNHLRGRRHQENIEALQGEGKGAEARLHEKEVPQLADKNLKPMPTWFCSICDANCTSQSDLKNHLRGRRHQQNIEALQGDGKDPEVSRWMCSICNANCTSQSDLESHLRGRRHQENIEALQGDGKDPEVSGWMCDICNANCTSQSDFESHLRGRRHQEKIEALEGDGRRHQENIEADDKGTEASRWMCDICNANCTSQSDLKSHLRGRRHQENIEALQGDGKGTEVSRWMCNICNANCLSRSDFESHLRGRRHQSNLQA
ncbi:zinc finger matrin-type protein 1-like [Triticum dicoccoides]|uniref:zinc finger matrin-type protein 1-like n=1 Tax=Triticum dicoccoides TaxID=85692 RepID=UPI0018916D97|nr:zinc finger matrin-type protein 1-like [Triticum dicoccoides]